MGENFTLGRKINKKPIENLCNIEFETAVSKYEEIHIDVFSGVDIISLEDFSKNGQWDLVDTRAESIERKGSKSKVRFSIVIERRRTFYVLTIILPIFFLSLTASLVFALPADEGEKMGTGITVLLAFAVYLTIVSEIVPNTSVQVSLLGVYLTILLGLCVLSVIICVFNLRLHHRDDHKSVGSKTTRFIRICRSILCFDDRVQHSKNQVSPARSRADIHEMMALQHVGKTNQKPQSAPRHDFVRSFSDESIKKHHPETLGSGSTQPLPEPEEELEQMTWQLVAHTLDWIFFIVFTIASIAVTLVLLLYLHFGSIADVPSFE